MAPDMLRSMFADCGLASLLGLNDEYARTQLDLFERVYESVSKLSTPDEKRLPCTVLTCFLANSEDAERFHIRTKFSNAERTLTEFIVENRDQAEENKNSLRHFQILYAYTSYEAGRKFFENISNVCADFYSKTYLGKI